MDRNEAIELLESYSIFLERDGYLDTDWRAEAPYAIDNFMSTRTFDGESKETIQKSLKILNDSEWTNRLYFK